MPTNKEPFLTRRTLGQPNYLVVALAAAFLIALTPLGAYRALQGSSNNLDAALPATHAEIVDLEWFREQFDGDQFVMVSWDGCTLAEAPRLQRVARELAPETNGGAGEPLFSRVITGPQVLEQLMAPPYDLPYDVAVRRLEGAIVGPAEAGARGGDDQAQRTTCLAAYLSPFASEDEALRRQAIDRIREVVMAEAHVQPNAIRMVGPAIDAIAIDDESQRTVVVLGLVAAGFGLVIACWRLRSVALGALVTAAGVLSAAATLAVVFYTGVLEVIAFNRVAPQLGQADALMAASAFIVYVLAIATAIRLVDYYRDAEVNGIEQGAVEHAVVDGWPYWLLSPLMVAAVVGVLCLSDLLPAQKFGLFTGVGLIVSAAIVLSLVAVVLHRFAPTRDLLRVWRDDADRARAPRWLNGIFECGITAHLAVLVLAFAAMGLGAYGMTRLDVEPRLPALVGPRSTLMQNYAWFAEHVGNAVPMEVIVTVPVERTRTANEPAEADGQQYRLTLQERMQLMQDLERGLANMEHIGAIVSPGTAMPAADTLADNASAVRAALEQHGYVRVERHAGSDQPTGRELWRLSARVSAATPEQGAIDYSDIVYQVRAAVNPVLSAYEQRDMLVGALHQAGKKLEGARIAILFRAPAAQTEPTEGSTEALLADLLPRSGVAGGSVTLVNLSALEGSDRAGEALRTQILTDLRRFDAVAAAAAVSEDDEIASIAATGANVVRVGNAQSVEESQAFQLAQAGGPRPIRAVFTGEPPVASVANLELLVTLRQSAMYVIPALAVVLMFVAWHPVGGLLSLVPVLFPASVSLGLLGWLGIDVDMGVVLIGALAMAVAIDGTMSFLSWFHQGAKAGLCRPEAARLAYSRVAPGMLDTTLIAGLGMLVFGLSGLAFMQQFALAAIGVMISAMAGTLLVLPAIATSPLGRFFNAEPADPEHIQTLAPLATDEAVAAEPKHDEGQARTDAAAATQSAGPHRAQTGLPADERLDPAEGPHASLHARLQRLRRPTGDSPTS
jgi:predicted RND superfamily exporter protein